MTPCDHTGCQHVSADGQLELDVPAGALLNGQSINIQATQFDQVQFLPNGELPPQTEETYAFNLSGASEISFTTPITVRLKNDRGFDPGTPIPLGYWNQVTLEWEHVGTSYVDDTGEWVVSHVTHFSNLDCNPPASTLAGADVNTENQTSTPGKKCKEDCDSSRVGLNTGSLRQSFSLPTVRVLDEPVGVTMHYDSQRANPNGIIDIAIRLEALTAAALNDADLIFAELFVEGLSTDQFTFTIDELDQDGEIGRFRYFWDGRDSQGQQVPPGVYSFAVKI